MINNTMGKHLHSVYHHSLPYPHIIFDEFIPNDIAIQCYNDMKQYPMWGFDKMEGYKEEYRDSQINKFFTPWDSHTNDNLKESMPVVWKTIQYFNSPLFTNFLSELTGITDLIPDLELAGGGCHKIGRGGRLEIHSDYNKHPNNDLWRRINLLLYLTPNWNEEWGGNLELWNHTPFEKTKSISPLFNRAVIFNTTDTALHGHPQLLNCPQDEYRYSIALYYFTKTRPEEEKSDSQSAIWYKTPYL